MSDRDGNRSNPYKPDPARCCEACVFGRGEHAAFCLSWDVLHHFDTLVPPGPCGCAACGTCKKANA